MKIRDLADLRFNSSLLRGVLRHFYREGDVCTVRLGPLRGARLIYHTSVNFHAILGLWDLDVFRYLQKVIVDGQLLGPQSTVADVGANIGFYSLWFAKRVKAVHAFEPAPEPQTILAENVALNQAGNISIVKAACGASNGTIDFFIAEHHHSSSLHSSWAGADLDHEPQRLTVPVTTLDSYFGENQKSWPDLIKMDIEGGGTFALPGAAKCLAEKRPFAVIESHTPQEDGAISHVLTTYDYLAYRFNNTKWVQDRNATHPNLEGVWGTMFLCPKEKQRDVLARM